MSRTLSTLGYPTLSIADRAVLDALRSKHDRRKAAVVQPHFTMVFGLTDQDETKYMKHVEAVADKENAIRFHCLYAMPGIGHSDDGAYVFLVPDEGNSAISLLHDRLYTGILACSLRLDLPYIPHITVGTSSGSREAKLLCDEINAKGLSISGKIEALTVAALDGSEVRDLSSFALRPSP